MPAVFAAFSHHTNPVPMARLELLRDLAAQIRARQHTLDHSLDAVTKLNHMRKSKRPPAYAKLRAALIEENKRLSKEIRSLDEFFWRV